MAMEATQLVTLYVCYSQKDEALKQEFEEYLCNLREARYIAGWIERQVQPGIDWSQVINPRLQDAQIFLLLMSLSLFASGYCSGAEFREAFEVRRPRGEMHVIPILLSPVDVGRHPLNSILWIPRNGLSISSWQKRDEAWRSIYWDIRHVAEKLSRHS